MAFDGLRRCVELEPGFGPGHVALAGLLASRGDGGPATDVLSRGLAATRPGSTDRRVVAAALIPRLSALNPAGYHPRLDEDLRACLAEDEVDRQALARVVARLLLLKHADVDADREAADPLWLAFLSRCLNVDPDMETRLAALRRAVTAAGGEAMTPARLELAAALALQAQAGEFLLDGEGGNLPILAALSRPLSDLGLDEAAVARLEASGAMAARLVRRGLRDPAEEARLAADLPVLTTGAGGDATSAEVRDQYEANPYPRWEAPPAPRRLSLAQVIGRLPRHAGDIPDRARVLVAGCGTGYEPIELARMDASLEVTAMDLSRASLGYAARMARETGAKVRFGQGDILDLEAANGPFDVVTCTGVLHHMDDPAAGLARLVAVTRPGGVLRLALYSERARAPVREARALIADRGWPATPDGVRAFRAHVLALPPEAPLAVLRDSDDFYSLSGCRDLAFHVIEHRYTPVQLGELVAGAGLRLIGFDAPSAALDLFRRTFGEAADALDLNLWDQLETGHPTLFPGMFQVWCQRPM